MIQKQDIHTGLHYTGASTEIDRTEEYGISGDIVLTLMKKYLKKNHILYVDNWYSSPMLFRFLFQSDTGACGTVKSNRKGKPIFGTLEKGQCEAAYCENLLAVKWCDKRNVHMLTSVNVQYKNVLENPTGGEAKT